MISSERKGGILKGVYLQNLLNVTEEKNLSRADLHRLVGISPQKIKQIDGTDGMEACPLLMAEKIAKLLEVSLVDVTGTPPRYSRYVSHRIGPMMSLNDPKLFTDTDVMKIHQSIKVPVGSIKNVMNRKLVYEGSAMAFASYFGREHTEIFSYNHFVPYNHKGRQLSLLEDVGIPENVQTLPGRGVSSEDYQEVAAKVYTKLEEANTNIETLRGDIDALFTLLSEQGGYTAEHQEQMVKAARKSEEIKEINGTQSSRGFFGWLKG